MIRSRRFNFKCKVVMQVNEGVIGDEKSDRRAWLIQRSDSSKDRAQNELAQVAKRASSHRLSNISHNCL